MVLQNICKVIQDYMQLPDGVIWLKNSKANLPTDSSFSIAVGFMSLRCFGTSVSQSFNSTMSEEIVSHMQGTISIDIMGRDMNVLTRKEEIIQAMSSTKCKEDQIANTYMIGSQPLSMNDISFLDGSEIPYRFQITFQIQFSTSKINSSIEYYDNFRTEELHEST